MSVRRVVGDVACNVLAGWAAPVLDMLEAEVAKASMRLRAAKGYRQT